MNATAAIALCLLMLAIAVAGLTFRRRGLTARVAEQLHAPAPAPRPDPIDKARLAERVAELRAEFGDDVARLMQTAAIEDLDRHLAILRGTAPSGPDETTAQQRSRSLHSVVGIAATLGCTELSDRARVLDTLEDAASESPAALHDLIADMQELRAGLAALQDRDPPASPAASWKG